MKKVLLTLTIAALSALTSQATIVLSNSFGYADGSLVTVSAGSPLGVWATHSGTTPGQVDVASGIVNLTQAESEDVNTVITNASFPVRFTSEVLYASFNVNFSALPATGAGAYFAHFKDTGTSYRCRTFMVTNGALTGKFRIGIGNYSVNSASANVPVDLDLSTTYKIVLRFQGSTNSTVWVNPTSEASAAQATASDSTPNSYNGSQAFALRQSNADGGIGTLTFDDLLIGTAFSDVQTVGGPPSISGLVNVSIPGNTNTGPRAFVVSDVETPAASLTVDATSDNSTLVPNNPANLTLASIDGSNRTLTVTPAVGEQGTAGIQVVVTDGNGDKATNSFTITVGLPSISTIADQLSLTNTVTGPVAFTVNDQETAPGSLTVTATSSDQAVLPDANIGIQNLGGGNRTITLTNAAAGVATVTVTVNDGTFNVSTTFKLTAYPDIGVVLGDDFTYTDGSIITNSGFFWSRHSGTTGQTQVASGKLNLTSANSEDINAYFTNAVANGGFPASGGFVFYSRFVVSFSALPTGSGGDYFAHFKEFGTSALKARVFALTNGAAPGTFRLGIANGNATVSSVFPQDLNLNTSYIVITRYNVATAGGSTLWVDPIAESSTSVTATDSTSTTTIYSYAFRQSGGIGTLTLDDLKIGTLFSEVIITGPPRLAVTLSGTDVVISWSTNFIGYNLEQRTNLNITNWTTGPSAVIVGPNYQATVSSPSDGGTVYRLKN